MRSRDIEELVDALKDLKKELRAQEKRASKKSKSKKEADERKKAKKQREKKIDRAVGYARKGGQIAGNFAAAATDPRDVTGVGSSQALNSALDSIVGQAGGGIIRNAAGLTELQNTQNVIQGGIDGIITQYAQAGLRPPRERIVQAAKQFNQIAQIQNEERKKAQAILEEEGISDKFGVVAQFNKVVETATKNLQALAAEFGKEAKRLGLGNG